MLRHGWRTGAIIPELEREIRIINTEQYMHSLTWQQALTGLLERMQVGSTGGLGLHLLNCVCPTSPYCVSPDLSGCRVATGAGYLDEGAARTEVSRPGPRQGPCPSLFSALMCALFLSPDASPRPYSMRSLGASSAPSTTPPTSPGASCASLTSTWPL